MSYTFATNNESPHLGGNIVEGDPWTYSPSVWNYVTKRFGIKSVLDLGSGLGYSSKWFKDAGLDVVSVDGLEFNVTYAVYPTVLHDITEKPFKTRVDLVHCQEVVEHIEEKYLNNLLDSLCCGKFILMTNAVPGQGGWHHVNEQPVEYWTSHLANRGYHLLEEDSKTIKNLATQDGAVWMAKTGTVYVNNSKFA